MKRSAQHGFESLRRSAEHGFESLRRSAEHGFTSLRRSAENGFTFLRRSAENGFTLIEMVVALLVFGLLAAAGTTLLSGSVRAQQASSERLAEVARERRLTALLASDLLQATPRITRGLAGEREAAFRGGNGVLLLSYVRRGWANGDEAPRASLQRVEITREGSRLIRSARAMVDGVVPANPVVLIGDVANVAVRFRLNGEWVDVWNPTRADGMPRAVELIIARKDKPPLRRLFIVGSDYVR